MLASLASYAVEKQVASDPAEFGNGAIQGVAGPEAANNAAAQLSFVPLLTLGIPGNPVVAMMLAAMVIHGIQPGPQVMTQRPELFWGFVASMWFGNLMLLVINLPLVGIWVQLLRIPYRILFPAILFFCCLGTFSLNNSVFEVGLAIGFGAFGFILDQAQARGSATASRLRPGTGTGREPASRSAHLSRRLVNIHHTATKRRVPSNDGRNDRCNSHPHRR